MLCVYVAFPLPLWFIAAVFHRQRFIKGKNVWGLRKQAHFITQTSHGSSLHDRLGLLTRRAYCRVSWVWVSVRSLKVLLMQHYVGCQKLMNASVSSWALFVCAQLVEPLQKRWHLFLSVFQLGKVMEKCFCQTAVMPCWTWTHWMSHDHVLRSTTTLSFQLHIYERFLPEPFLSRFTHNPSHPHFLALPILSFTLSIHDSHYLTCSHDLLLFHFLPLFLCTKFLSFIYLFLIVSFHEQ